MDVSVVDIDLGTASNLETFPLGTKHAVVIAKEKQVIRDAEFFENVARNRGMQARSFTDYDEATAWLFT
jgi:hypothetical protein